jgi:glycosyltransferase involved in cell wall biosynthesis
MRICLVSQEYPPETAKGGLGTQTYLKAHGLASLGHEVHVISASPTGQLTEKQDGRVHIIRIESLHELVPLYTPAAQWVAHSTGVAAAVWQLHKQSPLDLVDFAEWGAEGFTHLLNRTQWNWLPVVVQLHGPLAMFVECIGWPDRGSDLHKIGTFMEKYCIRQADALMACSHKIADFTATQYGVPRAAIDVVHCGVDADAFRPAPGPRCANSRPTVLFAGNIAKNKGVITVVEAALRLQRQYPTLKLQIAGKPTPLLQELCARPGADTLIEPLGYVDRQTLPELLHQADVFCAPSDYETGVANVYLEAMACGCPVIASTAGAAPEAIADGTTGLLVPPCDVEATAAALDRILRHPAVGQQLATAARKHVESYFSMDKYFDRVLAVYEKARQRFPQAT